MPLMFFADDVDAEKLLRKAAEWGWNISGYRCRAGSRIAPEESPRLRQQLTPFLTPPL